MYVGATNPDKKGNPDEVCYDALARVRKTMDDARANGEAETHEIAKRTLAGLSAIPLRCRTWGRCDQEWETHRLAVTAQSFNLGAMASGSHMWGNVSGPGTAIIPDPADDDGDIDLPTGCCSWPGYEYDIYRDAMVCEGCGNIVEVKR